MDGPAPGSSTAPNGRRTSTLTCGGGSQLLPTSRARALINEGTPATGPAATRTPEPIDLNDELALVRAVPGRHRTRLRKVVPDQPCPIIVLPGEPTRTRSRTTTPPPNLSRWTAFTTSSPTRAMTWTCSMTCWRASTRTQSASRRPTQPVSPNLNNRPSQNNKRRKPNRREPEPQAAQTCVNAAVDNSPSHDDASTAATT